MTIKLCLKDFGTIPGKVKGDLEMTMNCFCSKTENIYIMYMLLIEGLFYWVQIYIYSLTTDFKILVEEKFQRQN